MVNWFSAGVSSSQQISWPVAAALASGEIFRQARLFYSGHRRHPEVRAVFGEPRRMDLSQWPTLEARKSAHLRMTASE
jgi:hypothetical protein